MRKKIILVLVLITLLSLSFYFYSIYKNSSQTHVTINGQTVYVSLAKTPEKWQRGLSGRADLDSKEGMLFDFIGEERPVFWMKDMNFPIDIIWIGTNWQVAGIKHDLQPCPSTENCPTYAISDSVRFVLEVNSGWAEKNNVQMGDAVKVKLVQ